MKKNLRIISLVGIFVLLGFSFVRAAEPVAPSNNNSTLEAKADSSNSMSNNKTNSSNVNATATKGVNGKDTESNALKEGYLDANTKMGSVLSVRTIVGASGTVSLVFIVDSPFIADVRVLNFPFRLMIDIPMPYQWSVDSKEIANNVPISLVQGFRYGNPSKGVFRIVADLGRSISIDRSYVLKNSDGTYSFVVEINLLSNPRNAVTVSNAIVFANQPDVIRSIAKIAENNELESKKDKNESRISVQIKKYLDNVKYPRPVLKNDNKRVLVILDPGHGGKDSGAMSNDQTLTEKRLVLLVASKIKQKLEENLDIAVLITRSDDYYVPLKDRVFWAEFFKGDIFISIHADSSRTSIASSGLSIYTLSDVATDAQTQLLANDANRSDILGGDTLSSDDEEVNRILLSLSQRVRVNDSIELSKDIVNFAATEVKILQNPIRSAGFAVLKIPRIPSILIELGFLSNAEDVANFKREAYLDALANSVSLGVQSYLWNKGTFPKIPKALLENNPKNS